MPVKFLPVTVAIPALLIWIISLEINPFGVIPWRTVSAAKAVVNPVEPLELGLFCPSASPPWYTDLMSSTLYCLTAVIVLVCSKVSLTETLSPTLKEPYVWTKLWLFPFEPPDTEYPDAPLLKPLI